MKTMIRVAFIILLLLLVAGCSMQNSSLKKPGQQTDQNAEEIKINAELAQGSKETAKTVKGVRESRAIAINQDVTIAIKVSGFDRLHLKTIKNEVHDKIKELNKDYNVHVTFDKKHYEQLKQIESQLNGPQDKSMTDVLSKVNKIIKETQG